MKVRWPDGRISFQTDLKPGQRLVINQSNAVQQEDLAVAAHFTSGWDSSNSGSSMMSDITDRVGINWSHRESSYNDFKQFPLLLHMRSTEGPPLCTGDINNDGLDDFFVGGAAGQLGALFLQYGNDRGFEQAHQPVLESEQGSEDTHCTFFDADADGTPELYVARGSDEFPVGSNLYADRLYKMNDEGILIALDGALPKPQGGFKPTGVVRPVDLEGDGDTDLFVGVRMNPTVFGEPVGGYLLVNDGTGDFRDETDRLAPGLRAEKLNSAGITDAQFGDLNGDSMPDLVVAGEWMPITQFINRQGRLERADPGANGLQHTSGLWRSIALKDLNGDGNLDLVGGNLGLNSRFKASEEHPMQMWAGDLDNNGTTEHILAVYRNEEGYYPLAHLEKLWEKMPHMRQRFRTFEEYGGKTIDEIFEPGQLNRARHYQAAQLASIVGWNRGDATFQVNLRPFRAQMAPIYAILPRDLSGDRYPELLLGGNLNAVLPQAGTYNASYGLLLRKDSTDTFHAIPSRRSGFLSPGEVRDMEILNYGKEKILLVAKNNKPLQVFRVSDPSRENINLTRSQ